MNEVSLVGRIGRKIKKVVLLDRIRRRIRFARGMRPYWRLSRIVPTPAHPEPLETFAVYALVMAHNEEDIIGDSVANAFAQGADRVLLVDHHSSDSTVEIAIRNGAELIATFDQESFNDDLRIDLMNSIVDEVSTTSQHEHIWWLWFDADEFPRPASGGSIRQTLERLDREIRLVGARSLDHYPTPGQPEYVPGIHPASYQLLAREHHYSFCTRHHRKHPLQRWDREGALLRATGGFHAATCSSGPIAEADLDLVIHHIDWRNRNAVERRLAADGRLKAPRTNSAFYARLRSIEAVYSYDWANVWDHHPLARRPGIKVQDWREMKPRLSPDLPTWTLKDE